MEVHGAKEQPMKWLNRITWILIYSGLLLLVVALAAAQLDPNDVNILGWSLGSLGALATVAGVVCIYIRSRLSQQKSKEERNHGASR
jgi:malonyl CoA-acyl carrier protein transacylase